MPKKLSRTQYSALNVGFGFVAQIVTLLLSFITRTVFINALGTTYLGINGLFSDILRMLSLTELGLDTAMSFRLYRPLADHDTKRLQVLMKFYKTAYRVIGLAIILIGLILIPVLPILIKDYSTLAELNISAPFIFVLYVLQSATSYLFSASKAAIIKADQKTYITIVVGIIVTIAKNVSEIIVLLVFKDFVIYTAIAILYAIIQNLIIARIAKKQYKDIFAYTPNKMGKTEIRDMFKDVGALFIYKVNSVVIKASDNIVLSSCIGLTMVGLYSNYLLTYNAIASLLTRLYSGVKASMGNLFATAKVEKKYEMFQVLNFLTILLYGTAGIGLAVCSNKFITFWIGYEYVIAQPLPVLIGIELLFAGIKGNLGQIRTITGLYRQMWYRPIIGIVINLIVSFSLVFVLGINGVIIGTIASDFFANFMIDPRVIHTVYFENYRPVSDYYKKNIFYFSVLIVVGCLDFFICNIISIDNGIFEFMVHLSVCFITTPVALFLVFKNTTECTYLSKYLKRVLKRRV